MGAPNDRAKQLDLHGPLKPQTHQGVEVQVALELESHMTEASGNKFEGDEATLGSAKGVSIW